MISLLVAGMITFAQPRTRTVLTGFITDAHTGVALPGASVIISDSRNGTISDSAGHYQLTNIPAGHTIIEISFSGYKTIVEHIDISSSHTMNFSLTPAVLENEGVTITAVANATSIRKAPIPVTRVSRKELINTTSTNIIDALSRQPGISQLSSGPAVSKPVIRGLGYNRLVVINDGIRQEGQQWGDEHGIEIDQYSVNRVEIVKGPASLIYGSDAIAGVINIITTAPLPVNTIRGNILGSYQTNNRQRAFNANIGGNKYGFNWNLWGTYKAAADYSNRFDGRVYNSKFNEKNVGGYIGLNRSWGYSHFIVSSFNQKLGMVEGERNAFGNFIRPLPGGGDVMASNDDFNDTDPHVPYQHVNHIKFTSDNSFRVGKNRLSVVLGMQSNLRREFGEVDDPEQEELFFDLKTFNYSAAYHLNDRNGWSTSVGLNGMVQRNLNKAEEVLIPEYLLFDLGTFFYAQKTIGKSSFSGGLRYDNRSLEGKEYVDGTALKFSALKKNYSNFSASAGLSYSATENFVLKFNLAQGFRAPSVPELLSNGTHEGTNRYEYGSRDLRSERSLQGDLSSEWNSEHLSLVANVFYNHISHFIFYSRLPSVHGGDSVVDVEGELIPAFQFSQQDAFLTGGEFLIDLHPHPLDWLHWENRFSIVIGRFLQPVEGIRYLPLIPAPRWVSEIKGEFMKKGKFFRDLSFQVEVDHNFRQDHPFSAFGTETSTAGYTLLNAGLSTDIINKDKTLFSIYFNAMNIGDVGYQNHLSRLKYLDENAWTGRRGIYNMGRNFSVKINVPLRIE